MILVVFAIVMVLVSNHASSQDTPDTHGIQGKSYQAKAGKTKRGYPGKIHLGPLIISPSLSERVETNDNVFAVSNKGTKLDGQRERKKSDIINVASPGMLLTLPIRGGWWLPGKDHSLSINWHADYKNYRDNPEQNQHNHFFLAQGVFSFPKGFDVLIQDSYTDTFGAAGGETDNLHGVTTNIFSTTVSLPDYFRTFDVDLTYMNYDQQYDERSLRRANRNSNKFTLRIPYRIAPKIVVFPEYSYGFTKYDSQSAQTDPQSDSHMNEILAGVEWYATARTTGILKMGYTMQDYNETGTRDVNTFTAHLGMSVALTRRMQIGILAGRQPSVSEFTSGSTVYINNFGRIDFKRQIWKDWTASLYFRYDKNLYYDSERKDQIIDFGLYSRYDINKWMNIDVRYSHKDRDVNFELQSDRINTASIGINFAF